MKNSKLMTIKIQTNSEGGDMHAQISIPYSRAGLKALQQSLSLHGDLTKSSIWINPKTNQLDLRQNFPTSEAQARVNWSS